MDVQVGLLDLFGDRKLPLENFLAREEVKFFEQNPEIVETLERYRLPEITKLVCSSATLRHMPWAEKYSELCEIYISEKPLEAIESFIKNRDLKFFSETVFPYADDMIMKYILQCCDSIQKRQICLKKQHQEMEKEIVALEKKLKHEQAELAAIQPQTENDNRVDWKKQCYSKKGLCTKLKKQLAETKEKFSELKDQVSAIENQLTKIGVIENQAKQMLEHYEEETGKRREAVFDLLSPERMTEKAERLISNWVDFQTIPEDIEDDLRQEDFCSAVLNLLQDKYEDSAIEVLGGLYADGYIDLYAEPFSDFIKSNSDMLCRYLVSSLYQIQSVESAGLSNEQFKSWVAFAFYHEMQLLSDGQDYFGYNEFWCSIVSAEIWNDLVDNILAEEDGIQKLCSMLCLLSGKAKKIVLEITQTRLQAGDLNGLTLSEFVGLISSNDYLAHKDIVEYLVESLEKRLHKAERKAKAAERRERSVTQELFSAVYEPLEEMEAIVSDMENIQKTQSLKIARGKLKDSIIALRDGMRVLYIEPLADTMEWRNHTAVALDKTQHQYSGDHLPKKVHLRTMGFRYLNEEGNWEERLAKITPAYNKPVGKNLNKEKRQKKAFLTNNTQKNEGGPRKKLNANKQIHKKKRKAGKGKGQRR